ncbi:hypothetical protein D4R87_02505 [bacterium]|nr:MAG: hypothetical protein D4R87_02505 [bacterium]
MSKAFEDFKRNVDPNSGVTDEQVEIFFWLLVGENPYDITAALIKIKANRNNLAEKISRIFFELSAKQNNLIVHQLATK